MRQKPIIEPNRQSICERVILLIVSTAPDDDDDPPPDDTDNCPSGQIDTIRFDSDAHLELLGDELYDIVTPITALKIDGINGDCYTDHIMDRYTLLRIYSAQTLGVRIKVQSDCINKPRHRFWNFAVYRD